MTIEQKLEILKRAMELGADVEFRYFGERNKNEAEELASQFNEFHKMYAEPIDEESSTRWITLKADYEDKLEGAIFYD